MFKWLQEKAAALFNAVSNFFKEVFKSKKQKSTEEHERNLERLKGGVQLMKEAFPVLDQMDFMMDEYTAKVYIAEYKAIIETTDEIDPVEAARKRGYFSRLLQLSVREEDQAILYTLYNVIVAEIDARTKE